MSNKWQQWDRPLAGLLMISFFLPLRLQVGVMIPVCLFFAVRDFFLQKDKKQIPFKTALLLGIIYILYAAYLPFTTGIAKKDLQFGMEQKASLLLLPLLFSCISNTTRNIIYRQLPVFIIAAVACCIYANAVYTGISLTTHSQDWLNHVAYRLTFERITGVHPTYMGLYLCFCTAIVLWHKETAARISGRQQTILLFIIFTSLLALLPKTPLLALFFILGYYCAIHYRRKKQWKIPLLTMGVSLLIAYLAIPFNHQRIGEISRFFTGGPANPIDNSIDMRRIIWHTDIHVWQQHWLTGAGPGAIKSVLAQQYFGMSVLLKMPIPYYDTHNEYLNIWISFGITGIILMAVVLLVQYHKAIRNGNHLYICLLAALCICFTTENIWATQHGIVFYSFFTSLFFFLKQEPQTG